MLQFILMHNKNTPFWLLTKSTLTSGYIPFVIRKILCRNSTTKPPCDFWEVPNWLNCRLAHDGLSTGQ